MGTRTKFCSGVDLEAFTVGDLYLSLLSVARKQVKVMGRQTAEVNSLGVKLIFKINPELLFIL
ncbi:hypothetical protein PL10110_780012 [Planktothrix agardhii]|nr:hypothetical protein PL10110_780012 [Planktothrix agardhii]